MIYKRNQTKTNAIITFFFQRLLILAEATAKIISNFADLLLADRL